MFIKLNYRNIGYVENWKQFWLDLLDFRTKNSLHDKNPDNITKS